MLELDSCKKQQTHALGIHCAQAGTCGRRPCRRSHGGCRL